MVEEEQETGLMLTLSLLPRTWNQTELNEALVIVILNIKGKSVQTKQSMDVVYKPFFKIADVRVNQETQKR